MKHFILHVLIENKVLFLRLFSQELLLFFSYFSFVLVDDKTLTHYKIEDGAKLFLMLKKPGSGATPSTSSTPSSIKSTPQTPLTFPKVSEQETVPFRIEQDPTGFWEKLLTFLKRHFTEKDALKVLQEFKKVKRF